MTRRFLQLASLAAACLGGMAFSHGGWAVITVDDLLQTLPVGKPVQIAFTVRQHGVTLLDNLSPSVTASDGNARGEVSVSATRAGLGRYAATLTVPRAGDWTFTIHSGFGSGQVALLPILAASDEARTRFAEAPAERGRRLFVGKGCVSCHVHGGVEARPFAAVGPELTPRRYQADYLARLLADPTTARTPGQQWQMPNLGLKPAEIASLVSFINDERRVTSR